MVKIIKRNATAKRLMRVATKRPPSRTVTLTVNDWIAESRKNRLENDSSSRTTIAGWAVESQI